MHALAGPMFVTYAKKKPMLFGPFRASNLDGDFTVAAQLAFHASSMTLGFWVQLSCTPSRISRNARAFAFAGSVV